MVMRGSKRGLCAGRYTRACQKSHREIPTSAGVFVRGSRRGSCAGDVRCSLFLSRVGGTPPYQRGPPDAREIGFLAMSGSAGGTPDS